MRNATDTSPPVASPSFFPPSITLAPMASRGVVALGGPQGGAHVLHQPFTKGNVSCC
jgi:hypothetical protein